MEDLLQLDEATYGKFGGPREYSMMEGHLGGGGFINEPLAASDADGLGIQAPPPAPDGQRNNPTISPHMGTVGVAEFMNIADRLAGGSGWF